MRKFLLQELAPTGEGCGYHRPVKLFRQLVTALHTHTRLALGPAALQWADAPAGAALILLPAVGWIVGLVGCVVVALFGIALPTNIYSPLAAGVGCVAFTLALFGARNEEGLATMPRALRLVSPASFQSETLTVIASVLAKVSLLAVLAANSPGAVLCALFAGHVVSRFLPLMLPRLLDFIGNAEREGLAPIDSRALVLAAAWCALPLAVAGWARGPAFVLAALLASGLAMTLLVYLCRTRLQGYTRESFDAAQPCCEIAFLFGATVALGSP